MKCRQPYVSRFAAYPCGRCPTCLHNKRRIWTSRLMIEAADHEDNSFVTLTYKDAPRDVVPEHLQAWLKRFRSSISPRRIRFFGCGEYGSENWRPHYHVALFGWPPCQLLEKVSGDCPCTSCTVVRQTWGFGHVLLGTLEPSSAAYVCGYLVKRLTTIGDPRLKGRHPEFARMSLRPGIGAHAMWHVASEMMRYDSEVPSHLSNGRKGLLLGRYLRNKLKEMTGREKGATPEDLERLAASLQTVREYAFANDKSVSEVYAELNEGYEAKIEGKLNAQKHRRYL